MRRSLKLSSSQQKSREDPSEEGLRRALQSVTFKNQVLLGPSLGHLLPKTGLPENSLSNTRHQTQVISPLCDGSRTFWIIASHGLLENGGGEVLRSHSPTSFFSNKETEAISARFCLRLASHSQTVTDPGCLVSCVGGRAWAEGGGKSWDLQGRGELHSVRSHKAKPVAHLS